jgi:uncharacterized protein (DUF4415 family)
MTKNIAASPQGWDDEDTPPWTDDQLDRAELAVGGKVLRPAVGTLTRPGRPPSGDAPKRQLTLRIDPDVIDKFRADGPGWQGRMNAALRKAAGL